jgi:transposase InsO family protein
MYLQRYHEVAVSRSGVWRILKRLGLNRLPASQRYQRRDRKWKRHEKQQPGHRVQIDVKFIEPLASAAASTTGNSADTAARPPVRSGRRGKYYQFTAIDDCTRLRVLRITRSATKRPPSSSSTTSWIGCRSKSRSSKPTTAPNSRQRFTGMCRTRGLVTSTSNPARPRLNGKVERSHRIDAEEFYRLLDGVVIDDAKVFNDKLQEWEDYYNYHRPHGALDGQTPYERLRQKTHPAVADLPQPHILSLILSLICVVE